MSDFVPRVAEPPEDQTGKSSHREPLARKLAIENPGQWVHATQPGASGRTHVPSWAKGPLWERRYVTVGVPEARGAYVRYIGDGE